MNGSGGSGVPTTLELDQATRLSMPNAAGRCIHQKANKPPPASRTMAVRTTIAAIFSRGPSPIGQSSSFESALEKLRCFHHAPASTHLRHGAMMCNKRQESYFYICSRGKFQKGVIQHWPGCRVVRAVAVRIKSALEIVNAKRKILDSCICPGCHCFAPFTLPRDTRG